MTFRIQLNSSSPLNKIQKELEGGFEEVSRVIARKLVHKTAEEVKKRIPTGGGWLDIYKRAIAYRESQDGNDFAVAGLSEINLREPPADTSLLAFQGNDDFSAILEPYNPWPIDMIPPIAGGYQGNAVVRNVAPAEVGAARERIRPLIGTIQSALTDAGASVLPDEFLVEINGKVYADIIYMAERMERGYLGYPRIAHWGPAASKLKSSAARWASQSDVKSDALSAMRGKVADSATTMSNAEAAKLKQIRDSTWS